MHCALTISEIFALILERVADSYRKRDLARLARTCRAFREPAERCLWGRFLTEQKTVQVAKSFVSYENGDDVDLEQLQYFRTRLEFVRELVLGAGRKERIKQHGPYTHIRAWVSSIDCPFHLLHRLHFTVGSAEDFDLLQKLLPSSLKVLEVRATDSLTKTRFTQWADAFSFFLEALAIKAKDLEVLESELLISLSKGVEMKVAETLGHLPRLRVLSCDTIALHPVVLETLCRSSTLEEFCVPSWPLRRRLAAPRAYLCGPLHSYRFIALRHLECTLEFPTAAALLGLACNTIESIELSTWPEDTASQDDQLVQLFETVKRCHLLQSFFLCIEQRSWHHDHDDDEPQPLQPPMHLPPLTMLPRGLSKLKVHFGWPSIMALTDTDIECLTSTCPDLKGVELDWALSYYKVGRAPHTITLRSLATLAARCPHLMFLELPNIDTSVHVPLPPVPVSDNHIEIVLCESQEPPFEQEYVSDFFASTWPNADIRLPDSCDEGDALVVNWEKAIDRFYEKTGAGSSNDSDCSESFGSEDDDSLPLEEISSVLEVVEGTK